MIQRLVLIMILLMGAGLLETACQTESPQTFTVGVINHAPVADPALDGFKAGMVDLGYVEGQNITYLYQGATGSLDSLDSVAQDLLKADVDLLLALSTPATLAAKQAAVGTTIPVIFAPASDPVGAGIVDDLSQPGVNVTGVTFGLQEAKRLEWLVTIAPSVKHIYFPYNPDDKSPVVALEKLNQAASKLNVEFVPQPVYTSAELTEALQTIPDNIDAIWIPTDALVASHQDEFVKIAWQRRLPLTVPQRSGVELGALFSYGFSLYRLGQQAAPLADQIFQGTPAADLPVETAEFLLAINLKTAASIGLEIPDEILEKADIIIR